jgi:hypothetical protein
MYLRPPEPPKPRTKFLENFARQNESYSVGNRVYNGGAPSPHAGGGLDPTGYQERDALARTTKQNAIMNMIKQRKGM